MVAASFPLSEKTYLSWGPRMIGWRVRQVTVNRNRNATRCAEVWRSLLNQHLDQVAFQSLASLKTLLVKQGVLLLQRLMVEQCMLGNGKPWEMSMILPGSFLSSDDKLVWVYILFCWDFNRVFWFSFWLWNIPIRIFCILKSQEFITRVVALNIWCAWNSPLGSLLENLGPQALGWMLDFIGQEWGWGSAV